MANAIQRADNFENGSSRAITPGKTRRRDSGALMPGLAGLFNRRTGCKRTGMI
jgi:hypothetical protein